MRYYGRMLRIAFYVIVLVLALSFFGISIQSIVHSPAGQANFGYLGMVLATLWDFIVTLVAGVYHAIVGIIHA